MAAAFKASHDPEMAKGTTLIKINFLDFKIKLEGTSQTVNDLFAEICHTHVFSEAVRFAVRDMTRAEVAKAMRKGGFPEKVVKEFEADDLWPDLIG